MLVAFYLSSLLILVSTLGFGLIVKKFLNLNLFSNNYGFSGILGLFILSIFSSYSHLITAHNYYHNLFLIFVGIIFFIFCRGKNKNLIDLVIIFTIFFIAILLSKNNEDFGYYHLPNSIQFAQQKIQFGLGNLNHGFKHISSLFMLISLNYLPKFEYYLFNLTNLMFYVFFIQFLFNEITKNKKMDNFTKIIMSLFLVLFLTKFSRLAEFGSDISGQIILIIFLYFILELIYNSQLNQKEKFDYLSLAGLLIVFSITLKFISIIYLLFLLMAAYFLFRKNHKTIFLKYLNSKYFFLSFLSITIFLFLNFAATGCIIYPVKSLCFSEKVSWALDRQTVDYLNFHYELWSKGGLGPNIKVENPAEYISMFNWAPHWIKVYLFNKFSDYILVSFLIILTFYAFYFKNNNKKFSRLDDLKKKDLIVLLVAFFIFLIWFINFPTLRYAGYVIVFFLIIFPFCIFLRNKVDLKQKKDLKKLCIIFAISYIIFVSKNVSRINKELAVSYENHHNFKNFPFFWVKNNKYESINLNGHTLYKVEGSCWNTPSTCVRNISNLKIVKKKDYIIYVNIHKK